jgi:hypothetical protein
MKKTARGIDKLFFLTNVRYNLGEVGRYRMNKNGLDIPMEKASA